MRVSPGFGRARNLEVADLRGCTPLSSEHGTYKTVKARFQPWLSGESPQTRLRPSLLTCLCLALPTETKVESGTSHSKSGTSVNLSNSGNLEVADLRGELHTQRRVPAGVATQIQFFSRFGIWDSGFRIRVSEFGFRACGAGRVPALPLLGTIRRWEGFGIPVSGFGVRDSGVWCGARACPSTPWPAPTASRPPVYRTENEDSTRNPCNPSSRY